MQSSGVFELLCVEEGTSARRGRLRLPHGVVETPVFMTVGTRATVKGVTPDQLRDAGTPMVLGNTYHLALRPGDELIGKLGGLRRFMAWDGPMLTDSGGYQVFSLESLRRIDEDGVEFRSHIDGRPLRMTPESAVAIQENLGADVMMCFDECPPATAPPEQVAKAVERTTRWAARCREAQTREDQSLFGIVQGGLDAELRERSARELVALDLPGYAVGGLSVGETRDEMLGTLEVVAPLLPSGKPRYLMGVGTPEDLLLAVARGVDMFDCVMPTRNGRNATAFTWSGPVKLRNAVHAEDERPIDERCRCLACRTFSRAYLRHLFLVGEMLGPTLASIHNLAFYNDLMAAIRDAIENRRYSTFLEETLKGLRADRPGEASEKGETGDFPSAEEGDGGRTETAG